MNRPPVHLSESFNRISSIDALRGLAAFSVMLYHARGIFWTGFVDTYHRYGLGPNFNAWAGYLSEPFSYGFLGVNLFFVLSGYCIHRAGALKLARNPQARLDCRAFALRRFWRIYPTYVAALILTALVDAWIGTRQTITDEDQDNSLFTFVVSLFTLQGFFAPYYGDNAVFWTLAIEVHLYIAYPVLFYLSRRYGPRPAVLFTLAVTAAYLAADGLLGLEKHLPYRAVEGPVFLPYWFTWAVGFFIAEVEAGRTGDLPGRAWIWLMMGGLLLGLPQVLHGSHPKFAEPFLALFCGGILRWSIGRQGRLFWSGWLGAGAASIGVMSYSLYAVHNPLLGVFHSLIAPTYHYKFETIWPTLGGVIFVLPLAWIFFQLVERWTLRAPASPVTAKGLQDGQ